MNSIKVGESYDVNRSFGNSSQPNSINFSKVQVNESKMVKNELEKVKSLNSVPNENINTLSPERKEKGVLEKAEELLRSLEKIQKESLPEEPREIISYERK